MQMMFHELYIFSSVERLARRIEFSAGINIVTSSKKNGNQRGKSVVLKCLYFALGAETKLDDTFHADDKVVILRLTIDGCGFYVLRAGSLHKIFDDNKTLLFKTVKASDLAEWLSEKTKFGCSAKSGTGIAVCGMELLREAA